MNIEADGSKFTWGDSVVIRKDSPAKFHPGEFASVCGFYRMQSREIAKQLECKIGDWVYTVEFGDGSDIQVPECYLDKDFSSIPGEELSQYSHYFVNGIISETTFGIDFTKIKLKSSFVSQQVSEDKFFLKDGFFVGTLTGFQIVKFVMKNDNHVSGREQVGNILSFEISGQVLKLHIKWKKTGTTFLEIEARQFWWEQRI